MISLPNALQQLRLLVNCNRKNGAEDSEDVLAVNALVCSLRDTERFATDQVDVCIYIQMMKADVYVAKFTKKQLGGPDKCLVAFLRENIPPVHMLSAALLGLSPKVPECNLWGSLAPALRNLDSHPGLRGSVEAKELAHRLANAMDVIGRVHVAGHQTFIRLSCYLNGEVDLSVSIQPDPRGGGSTIYEGMAFPGIAEALIGFAESRAAEFELSILDEVQIF